MKFLLALSFLLSISSQAETVDDLVNIIKVRCDFFNEKISFDIRESCMLDYNNCGVNLGGVVDVNKLDECVDKRREEDDRIQN